MPVAPSEVYQFGTYKLDLSSRILTHAGAVVTLAPKTFDLLELLVKSNGRLLSKSELMDSLWPGAFVEEANLPFQISSLRRALGEDGAQWVETVPKHGYRFTAKVTEIGTAAPAEVPRAGGRRRWYAIIAGAVALSLAFYFAAPLRKHRERGAPLTVAPLTTYPGFQRNPSLSPDGSQVTFSWNGPNEDNYDIYMKLVGPGEPVRLTTDPAQDERPAWSPDGRFIAFLRRFGEYETSLFVIPALGGAERKLADVHALFRIGVPMADLAWSPDGKWLAFGGQPAESEPPGIWLVSVEDGHRRRLTTPPRGWPGDYAPAFAPDGHALAFVRVKSLAARDVYVLSLTSELLPKGEPVRRTFDNRTADGPAWTPDGRELVFSLGGHLGTRMLERVTADARAAEAKGGARVAAVGEQATTVSISRTGRLVYARETHDSNLWELRLSASGEAEAPPVRILSSTLDEHTPDYSPDGKRITFTSTRSGNEEIWMANADGSHPVQLTNMGGPSTVNPRWSPDGRKILFTSRPKGSSDLYLLDPSTGSWRRLTSDPANDVEPRWSRNGRWIYFGSNRTGRYEVWKMLPREERRFSLQSKADWPGMNR